MNAGASGQYSAMDSAQWAVVVAEPERKAPSVFAHAIEALRALDQRMGELVKAREAAAEKQ
jgi:hypothetical protein